MTTTLLPAPAGTTCVRMDQVFGNYCNRPAVGTYESARIAGKFFPFCAEHAPRAWKVEHTPAPAAKATRTRKPKARPDLPRIIRFDSKYDSGEYGNATCPHCGADGRYVWSFLCEDGKTHGAMAGCIKLFPVSAVAAEQQKIVERQADRAKKDQKLASWDLAKLDAMEKFYAGEMTEGECLRVIESENARRTAWMDRKHGRGR